MKLYFPRICEPAGCAAMNTHQDFSETLRWLAKCFWSIRRGIKAFLRSGYRRILSVSWIGQFLFQMVVVRNEAEQHGQPFAWSDFLPQFFSSLTLENWQSEFLQLVWQATGLALYFWGSSQSKESDDRLEAKIDALLREHDIDPTQFQYQEENKAEGGDKNAQGDGSDEQRRTTAEKQPTPSGS
jgi:hypothetical protein